MPQSSTEALELEGRRRVAQQVDDLVERNGGAPIATDSAEPEDYNYLFVPLRVLCDLADVPAFNDVARRRTELGFGLAVDEDATPDDRGLAAGLVSFPLPYDPVDDDRSPRQVVLDALDIFDDELGEGVVTPEHYLHLATNGTGRLCPATEPEETGLTTAWPPASQAGPDGSKVEVVIVDTGFVEDQISGLLPYYGHGSFAQAVIQGQAPNATPLPLSFPLYGGQPYVAGQTPPATLVAEADLVTVLTSAFSLDTATAPAPRVISIQAGCHTRRDRPLKAFEALWRQHLAQDENTVVVAAAGNDGSPLPFFPAASTWSWGVGSLDHDDEVSSFSNFRTSADVFVLGRNHVNTFPTGTYVCQEAPNTLDVREFSTGWARWSGTSFAAPLLAGLLAAHLSQTLNRSVREEARHFVRSNGSWRNHPVYGDHRVIELARVLQPDHSVLPPLP